MALIGTMTVQWAGIERMLDELIAYHQQQFTDLSKNHPRNLSDKLSYLQKVMQKSPIYFWGTKKFLRQIRIETRRLGEERHEIIHGLLGRSGSVSWRSQRVMYDGASARIRIRDFHSDDLVDLMKQIGALAHHMSPRIWIMIGNDHRKSPGGNVDHILAELLEPEPQSQV